MRLIVSIFAQLSTFVNIPVMRVMIKEELSDTFLIVFLTIAFVYTWFDTKPSTNKGTKMSGK
ncbi:hypothetical protein D3C84_1210530 [compost metagenome]